MRGRWPGLLMCSACVVFEPGATDGATSGVSGATGESTSGPSPTSSGLSGATSGSAVASSEGAAASESSDEGGPTVTASGPEDTGETGETGSEGVVPVVSEVWAYDAFDLGDVDGDGRVDLITANTGQPPRVTVHSGLGDGSFAGTDAAVVSEIPGFLGFVVADVTGDGRADVLAQGTGFPPRVTVRAGRADLEFDELMTTEVFTFTHMHAVDLDGDGRAELLTGNGDGDPPQIFVWPGTEFGVGDMPLFSDMVWQYGVLRGGDVDGDGLADVLTADPEPTAQRFSHAGDGAGGFGEPTAADLFKYSILDLGDVDGDGKADVVTDVPNNPWRFQLYRSAHDELEVPAVLDGFNTLAFELGDVDGDGRADIVAMPTGAPPRVEVYLAPFGL